MSERRVEYIDDVTHDLLEPLFGMVNISATPEIHQAWRFEYSSDWHSELDDELLCTTALALLTEYSSGFNDLSRTKEVKQEVFQTLLDRGITPDYVLKTLQDFQFSDLGEHTAPLVLMLADDIKNKQVKETSELGSWARRFSGRYKRQRKILDQYNEGRVNPLSLEQKVTFDKAPIAVTHDSEGTLYVLDSLGKVYAVQNGEIVRTFNPTWEYGTIEEMNRTPIFVDQRSSALPGIAVHDSFMYLTTGRNLERSDLDIEPEGQFDTRALISMTGLIRKQVEAGHKMFIHDVLVKEGNVLISVTKGEIGPSARRSILQVTEDGTNVVYQDGAPLDHSFSSLEDPTLRLGLFKGGLYFPESTGISLYTEQGPKRMLQEYVKDEATSWCFDPLTKFSFGDDFMIAASILRGSDFPLLTIFRPIYAEDTEAIVPVTELVQPERFEFVYANPFPRITVPMINRSSLSAYGDSFAITSPGFKQVLLYKVNQLSV